MAVNVHIDIITATVTFPLRQEILRPGRPLTSCYFEKDNDPHTRHWGAFIDKRLVGILSAMPNPCKEFSTDQAFQFRGMAVHPDYQRQGIATRLLLTAEKYLSEQFTPDLFWLNARIHAQALYSSLAYQAIGDEFEIPTVGPHRCFVKNLNLPL